MSDPFKVSSHFLLEQDTPETDSLSFSPALEDNMWEDGDDATEQTIPPRISLPTNRLPPHPARPSARSSLLQNHGRAVIPHARPQFIRPPFTLAAHTTNPSLTPVRLEAQRQSTPRPEHMQTQQMATPTGTRFEASRPLPREGFDEAFDGGFDEPDLDDSQDFALHATLPMMVLKGLSIKHGTPTPKMESEISGAAGNAGFIGLGNIMGTVIKYGITLFIQRWFGAATFGIYTLSMSFVGLFSSSFTLGLDDAMVRYVALYRSRDQAGSLRGLVMFCSVVAGIAGLVGAIIMIIFAPSLAALKHSNNSQLPQILQLLAPTIPLECMESIWTNGLEGFKDFRWRVLSQKLLVPASLIFFLAIIAFTFPDANLTGIAIAVLLNSLVSTVSALWFFFGKVTRFAKDAPETYELRQWLGFAAPNLLTNTMDLVLASVDTIVLAVAITSDIALGQYAAAQKICGFIGMPLAALNAMFSPTIAELHGKGENEKLEEMFKVVTKWAITFSLPIFGVATLFSVWLLGISGPKFVDAWPSLIAFALGNIVNVGTGSVGYMLMMTGHSKQSFYNSMISFALNLVLAIWLAPRYGAMGIAIATGSALAAVNLLRLIQVRVLLKMQPYRLDTLKPIGAWLGSTLFVGGILFALNEINFTVKLFNKVLPIQLGLVPVYLACYVGILFLLGVSPEDAVVLEAVKKKLNKFTGGKKAGKKKKKKK